MSRLFSSVALSRTIINRETILNDFISRSFSRVNKICQELKSKDESRIYREI